MPRGTEIGRGFIVVDVDEDGARAALRGFVGFAGSAFKAAAASAGVLITAAAKVGVSFDAMKEQAAVAFTTLLGNGEKAQAFLIDLQKFAASTPFELPGLIDNARSLLGVGIAADKVIPTMTALGNAAGALGLSQEQFNRVMLATTQAMGKGKLQGDELLQFVEAGIPVWQLLAKATGKPVPELQKLSEQGKLLSADVLPKLFAQMQKDYGGAMAAQSKTLAGQWSSLKDNTRILLGTAFKPLFDETKRVTGALNDLAQSDRATEFVDQFAIRLGAGIDAVKLFGRNVRTEMGPEFHGLVRRARDRFADLEPAIRDTLNNGLTAASKVIAAVLPQLLRLAESAGGLLKPALQALSGILKTVAENADQLSHFFATAASTVAAVAGPAFTILGAALQIVGHVLELVVRLVGDLSGPLGVLTGAVLAGVIAWRALSTVLGAVNSAWSRIAPAAVASRLGGMTKSIDNVALRAGVMVEGLTGSAKAGERVAVSGSKAGSALQKVGSALPLVGLAVVGIGIAMEQSAQQADNMAQASERLASALLKGGEEARKARRDIDLARALADAGAFLDDEADQIRRTVDEAEKSAQRQLNAMNAVQRAQTLAAAAQNDYDLAVRESGPASQEAAAKQQILIGATQDLEQAQRNAANAAKTHEQSLFDLATQALASANADIALRQAELSIKDAVQAVTDAEAQYGKGSAQAQQSTLNLEQAYIRAAAAARDKALADTQGKSESERAAAAQSAYTFELIKMAQAAGANAPPALRNLIAGLKTSELQAFSASQATGTFKTQVLTLPDGRTVTIAVNDQGTPVLQRTKTLLEQLRDKTITLTVQERRAFIREARFGDMRQWGGLARAGTPTVVGERGPELIVPRVDSQVFTAAETRHMLGTGPGDVDVKVFIGDQELRGMVRTEVSERDRETRRAVLAGVGGAR